MVWVLGIALAVIALLLGKIYMMRKAAREIREEFAEKVLADTNVPILLSGRDKEMQRLASQLNVSLKDLREAYHRYALGDREMKTAITNLAHDLRTPLTAISGYLSLAERLEKSDEVARYLDIIRDRADYMKALTEDLFEYSILTSVDHDLETEEVSLNQVLEDVVMSYFGALTERGIEPKIEITETRVVRTLNKPHLERIFSNLISNALKYSDGDLEICLTEDGRITFANSASKLTEVDVERMFDRFYTVETAKNQTGVGLSIVRAYAEKMGGTVMARYEKSRLMIEIRFAVAKNVGIC